MEKFKAFCKRKNIEVSAKRYGIDALGAMAQGLFCSLLIGTIIKTLGAQLGVPFLTDIGTYAMSVSGPAMAIAIGYALKADPMVLFSLAAVGWAANAEGGAGGPLAVLIIAILAAECGKAVSKETKIDILVTPAVTILVGVALAKWIAPPIGTALAAFAQPTITAATPAGKRLDAEGVMAVTLIYLPMDSDIPMAIHTREPFAMTFPIETTEDAQVQARVIEATPGPATSDRAEVRCVVGLHVVKHGVRPLDAVIDVAQQPAARPERFGTKFNTAVNGFYKSLDDTFKSFTLTAENGLDQIRAQSIGGSTAKGE